MKVEDMMLGDWVQVEGIPLRVGGLSNYDIYVDLFRSNESEVYSQIWADELDSIQPIPLTPEILEKNGFRYNEAPFVQGWEQFGLTLYRGGDGYRINCGQNVAMVIDSVHQLQNALRLVGIEKTIEL